MMMQAGSSSLIQQQSQTAAAGPAPLLPRAKSWSTWEDLLLAGAVQRHGHGDWRLVASELQTRAAFLNVSPEFFSVEECKARFCDLNSRFGSSPASSSRGSNGSADEILDGIPWMEELRKLRVAQLKRELDHYDLTIGYLEKKLKRLKAEKEGHDVDEEVPLPKSTRHKEKLSSAVTLLAETHLQASGGGCEEAALASVKEPEPLTEEKALQETCPKDQDSHDTSEITVPGQIQSAAVVALEAGEETKEHEEAGVPTECGNGNRDGDGEGEKECRQTERADLVAEEKDAVKNMEAERGGQGRDFGTAEERNEKFMPVEASSSAEDPPAPENPAVKTLIQQGPAVFSEINTSSEGERAKNPIESPTNLCSAGHSEDSPSLYSHKETNDGSGDSLAENLTETPVGDGDCKVDSCLQDSKIGSEDTKNEDCEDDEPVGRPVLIPTNAMDLLRLTYGSVQEDTTPVSTPETAEIAAVHEHDNFSATTPPLQNVTPSIQALVTVQESKMMDNNAEAGTTNKACTELLSSSVTVLEMKAQAKSSTEAAADTTKGSLGAVLILKTDEATIGAEAEAEAESKGNCETFQEEMHEVAETGVMMVDEGQIQSGLPVEVESKHCSQPISETGVELPVGRKLDLEDATAISTHSLALTDAKETEAAAAGVEEERLLDSIVALEHESVPAETLALSTPEVVGGEEPIVEEGFPAMKSTAIVHTSLNPELELKPCSLREDQPTEKKDAIATDEVSEHHLLPEEPLITTVGAAAVEVATTTATATAAAAEKEEGGRLVQNQSNPDHDSEDNHSGQGDDNVLLKDLCQVSLKRNPGKHHRSGSTSGLTSKLGGTLNRHARAKQEHAQPEKGTAASSEAGAGRHRPPSDGNVRTVAGPAIEHTKDVKIEKSDESVKPDASLTGITDNGTLKDDGRVQVNQEEEVASGNTENAEDKQVTPPTTTCLEEEVNETDPPVDSTGPVQKKEILAFRRMGRPKSNRSGRSLNRRPPPLHTSEQKEEEEEECKSRKEGFVSIIPEEVVITTGRRKNRLRSQPVTAANKPPLMGDESANALSEKGKAATGDDAMGDESANPSSEKGKAAIGDDTMGDESANALSEKGKAAIGDDTMGDESANALSEKGKAAIGDDAMGDESANALSEKGKAAIGDDAMGDESANALSEKGKAAIGDDAQVGEPTGGQEDDEEEEKREEEEEEEEVSVVGSDEEEHPQQQPDNMTNDSQFEKSEVGGGDQEGIEETSPLSRRRRRGESKVAGKLQHLLECLRLLSAHRFAPLFKNRQESQMDARYELLIRRHMDLSMVRRQLENGVYSRSVEMFRDLLLIFNNAVVFYSKESQEYGAARVMRECVMKEMERVFETEALLKSAGPSTRKREPRKKPPEKAKKTPPRRKESLRSFLNNIKNDADTQQVDNSRDELKGAATNRSSSSNDDAAAETSRTREEMADPNPPLTTLKLEEANERGKKLGSKMEEGHGEENTSLLASNSREKEPPNTSPPPLPSPSPSTGAIGSSRAGRGAGAGRRSSGTSNAGRRSRNVAAAASGRGGGGGGSGGRTSGNGTTATTSTPPPAHVQKRSRSRKVL